MKNTLMELVALVPPGAVTVGLDVVTAPPAGLPAAAVLGPDESPALCPTCHAQNTCWQNNDDGASCEVCPAVWFAGSQWA